MDWKLFSVAEVIEIHELAINEGELAGLAKDKTLEGALARVEHRIHYGLINDTFDLAAGYAHALATGHCFNDANKRTAYTALHVVLSAHEEKIVVDNIETAKQIIALATSELDEVALAEWLRKHAG